MKSYFASLYSRDKDPYKVQTRWYEKRKIQLLLGSLPKERYEYAFEPGVGVGALSQPLSERCERLIVSDLNEKAIRSTKDALKKAKNVDYIVSAIPAYWPPEETRFDLIVLSEILYFLDEIELEEVIDKCQQSLLPSGNIVICNWKHAFTQRKLSTEFIHACFSSITDLRLIVKHEEDDFLLDVYSKDPLSIAQSEGIL